jgi:hypothetical protein
MQPLTVIVGILLGSCLSITVCLAAILLVYALLGSEHPLLAQEYRPLALSVLIFLGMTALAAASFYTLLIEHRLRYWALLLLLAGLTATTGYYLP